MEIFRSLGLACLTFAILLSKPISAAKGFRHLSLKEGEIKEFDLGAAKDLFLNKKGIVMAEHIGGNRWQLLALKKGQALMQIGDRKWLVDIKKDERKKNAATNLVPDWICKSTGLRCDEGPSIRGMGEDYVKFLQAKIWCQENKSCLFLAGLTEQAQDQLHTFLHQRILDTERIIRSEGGSFTIECVCEDSKSPKFVSASHRKRIDTTTGGLLKKGLINVKCREPDSLGLFQIEANIVLLNDSNQDQLGFELPISSSPLGSKSFGEDILFDRLRSLLSENKAQVLAKPMIKAVVGKEASLSSGGEFRNSQSQMLNKYSKEWKQYGLKIKVLLSEEKPETIGVSFDLSLSMPTQSTSLEKLKSNSLKTHIYARYGREISLGNIDFSSNQLEEKSQYAFCQTPIIGPFFRSKKCSQGSLKGFVNLRVIKAEEPSRTTDSINIEKSALSDKQAFYN